MSAHDVSHRIAAIGGDLGGATLAVTGPPGVAGVSDAVGRDAVADRVPAEYREAYLEGFARARAISEDTAA